MGKVIVGLAIVFSLVSGNTAIAQEWWSSNLTIVSVSQLSSGQVLVKYYPQNSTNIYQNMTAVNDPNTKAILVSLLAAQAAHSRINLLINSVDDHNYVVGLTVLSNLL